MTYLEDVKKRKINTIMVVRSCNSKDKKNTIVVVRSCNSKDKKYHSGSEKL
jgi:hypothetical protein